MLQSDTNMLPKKYRLIKREDFSTVYSKGSYVGQDDIAIKYLKSNQSVSRIGFSIGKNFSKKAVLRNRARRVIQEVCRFYIQSLKPGFDIVIMPKPAQEGIELDKTKDILRQIFKKANLFT